MFQVDELKAAMSNKEYQIITECAQSNVSETPRNVPVLSHDVASSSGDIVESVSSMKPAEASSEMPRGDVWILTEVSVVINLVELRLHLGTTRDASLAVLQVCF